MTEYITVLAAEFEKNKNPAIALQQKAYMRNQFEFFGIKAPIRAEIQKPFFLKEYRLAKKELDRIIKILWKKPQREYQNFAQELVFKYVKQFEKKDIALLEYMVMHKSWWDTVDFIAVKLMGAYFKKYPKQINPYVKKWIASENIWLQRSALLFQLKYKSEMDTQLLTNTIEALLGSKEFFINKAIGWVLREYSKINPKWVIDFVTEHDLAPLSKKESLRLLDKE